MTPLIAPPPANGTSRRAPGRAASIVLAGLVIAVGAGLLLREHFGRPRAAPEAPSSRPDRPHAAAASPAPSVERSYTLASGGRFHLSLESGDVTVSPGAGRDVRIVATLPLDLSPADLEWRERSVTESEVSISLRCSGKADRSFLGGLVRLDHGGSGPRDVRVEIPADAKAEIETGFGDVTIAGIASVRVGSGAGDVSVSGATSSAVVDTGAGTVEVSGGGEAVVKSGAGDIDVSASGAVDVATGAGSVSLGGSPSEVRTRSGAGDVRIALDDMTGPVTAVTGLGSVTLKAPGGAGFRLVASSGIGSVTLHSSSGTLKAPGVGGRLTARIGTGGPEIRLETGAGSVEVKTPEPAAKDDAT